MRSEGQGVFRTLLPTGSVVFILSIICSIIALVSASAMVILAFGKHINPDFLTKLIVGTFLAGLFFIVYPNLRLTRGARWPLTHMSLLLCSCILLMLATLVWSYFQGSENVHVGALAGLASGVVGLSGYRSKALETLRAHFDQIWQDEYRRRTHLRNDK